MPKLPLISGIEAVKALGKLGYKLDHQTGSHIILRQQEEPHRRLTVPNHKELAKRIGKRNIKGNNKTSGLNG